jgi:hypothetical protein
MSNPIDDMTTDLAWHYGSKLPDWPHAESSLHILAALAGKDYAWALREVMNEWENIRYGQTL